MERDIWSQPVATVQPFVANEYVATCWSVACDVMGSENEVADSTKMAGVTHRKAFCGDGDHYLISVDDNGTPTSMTEIRTDNLGDLPCNLYQDSAYSTPRNISDVNVGDYIYWTTSSGNKVWHHAGTVSGSSTNHS